ncbi:titin [Elysia marginata]|uniref:non-specific serine/threonine protein kinase n=1 Tax=Elysia marginata TaxID=1093978 RepID=A0AAV4HSJ3_9GAST|nr:titin [Elysia marginata]
MNSFSSASFGAGSICNLPFSELPLKVTLTLARVESEVERSAIFTCMLSKVDLRVSWYKEEEKLQASSKHELVDLGRMHKLIVHDLCPADYTDYLVAIGSRRLTGRRLLEEAPLEFTIPLTEQTCKEGDTVTFKCEVTESDLPATWFKDGLEVILSDQVIASVDGKTHTLTIKDTPLDADAEYTVKIKDKESKAKLNVQEVAADFTLPLSDTTAQAHESATFTCEVTKDDADVQWLVNNKEVTPNEKFKVAKDGRKHSLTVVDLQPEDSGEFTARVGGNDTSASLTVSEEPLEIIVPLKELEVTEGDTATLTCKVNKPNVKATWYKEGVPVTSGDRCVLAMDGDTHTLTLRDADLEDEAEYTIKLGDKSSTALLLVEVELNHILKTLSQKDGHVITEEDGYEFIMDNKRHILKIPETTVEHDAEFIVKINGCESKARLRVDEVAAEFTATLKDVEGQEGQDVELECILSKPDVKVRWLKNKKPLTPSDRIKIVCDRYRHYLRIMDTIPEDEGEYTAVLPSNRESSANLKIYEIQPFFTMPLKDQELPEKEMAIFECQVSKKDKPVKWLKDGKEVELDNRIQAITDGFYQQLVIEDCRLDDAGRYSCVVGDEVTEANLVVEELPVEILKPLRNVTATEGEKIVLEVELSKPDYPVTWKRDGVTFKPGDKSRVIVDGCIHRLEIDAAELDDEANYSLHAGDKSCKALVLVEELAVEIIKPLEDQNIVEKEPIEFTCELSKPGVKVSWLKDGFKVSEEDGFKITTDGAKHTITKDSATLDDAGKYMLVFEDKKTFANLGVEQEPLEITKPLENIDVKEGEKATFTCEVSKPDLDSKWSINDKEISSEDGYDITATGKTHALTLEKVAVEDAGKYKVKIKDKESSAKLKVREIPLEFTKPLKDTEVMENQQLTLTCEVNKPDLEAKWTRDGKVLDSSDRIHISRDGCVHSLTIEKSELGDASIYRVSIKDKKTSAKVAVKEEPLEFIKPLADIEVQENQKIFLECTLSKPDRKVTWYKNAVKLPASDTVKLVCDAATHTLTIDRAELSDQAEYSVKVDGKTSKAKVKVIESELEFIRNLEDTTITEIPKTLVFEAEVSKINVPAKWYHNDKVISADEKHELFGKGVIHRLTITDADGRDEGDYKVVVKDKSSEAKLTVQVPPKIFVDKKYQETVVLNAGQSTAFEIPFSGNPQPKVTWTFKSGPLPDAKRMEAETIYNMTTVRLGHVIRSDSGDYTVKLENTNGVAEITINLLVLDKPSVPRDFTVSEITAETVCLSWSPPEDDGGRPVKSYTLEKRDASRQTWTSVAEVKDTSPYTVKSLTEGKQYVFRVNAKNEVGASKFVESETITAKNPFDVPDAPDAPVVKDVSKNKAVVTWQPPAKDNGAPVTGYLLERMSGISPRWVAVNKEPVPDTELQVTDLVEDNTYQFRVSAVNRAGPSKPSEPSPSIKAKDPFVAPGRPGTPEATGTDKSSVALKWAAPESDGGSPILNYVVEYRPEGSSQWKRANEKTTVPDTTFSVTGLKKDRQYEFRVTAENLAGPGEPSKPTEAIKVVEPVTGEPPVLLEPLQDIAVVAPNDAILECDIDVGEPEAEIKWFRGKKEVRKSSKYEMSYEDEVASLVIHKTEPQDSDVYRCEASNPLGKVHTEGTLAIHTLPTLEYDNRLKSAQTLKAGSTITLKVNVAGIPTPTVSWLVDGQPLDKTDRVSIETSKDFSTLTIKNATINDSGVYTISAENVVGKAAADFEVNVKDKPGAPENLQALEIMKNSIALAWEPPLNAGGSAITGYIVEKREANKNTWMPVTTTDGTTTAFSAQKLSEGKEYFFRVSAQNDFGTGEPTELKEGIVAKSPYDAPEAPKKLTATEITKSSVTLTWEPPESDGGSPITGYVLERKSPTSSRWVRVNKSPIRDTVYTVSDLTEGDQYEFRVMAENAAGCGNPSATTERLLAKDPYDKPEAPKRPEAVDITRTSVTLKWLPPASDGGNAIVNYVVEYRPTSATRWKVANPAGGAVADTSFTAKQLEEGTVYEFRVAAENKAGVGPFSQPSEPITAVDPVVGEAPTVLEGLPDVAVTEGETALLGCKISGEPAPTIKWLKDGRELAEDKRHEMVYQDFVASLAVKDVQAKDAGTFTCQASNDLGTVNTSGVLEIQAAPTLDFDNKFKDLISLHAGATLKIPVRVGGIPIPSISWKQENKSLRTAGNITVDIQETSTCLTVKKVTKEDDGLYSLQAENEVGQATAKFDVEILDKPSAPEGPIAVSNLTKDSATLTWKPPKDDGGCDLTGYIVERRDAKRNTWTKMATLDGVTLDYKATKLVEGNDYHFRVTAENEVGQSEPLETSAAVVPKSPFDKPSAPEGPIEFSDLKADSVTLSWKPPTSDGGSPIKNYIVERKDARKTSWTKVSTVDAKSPLSCVAQKLLEDVPYMFRVMAINEEGQSPPLEADKEIVPKAPADVPGKPTGPIKFSQILADSVTLAWGPPKKDGGSVVTSYTVEQSRDNGRSWEQTGTVEAHTTMLTAKDLKEGQKYKFRVCANNEVGAGQPLESDNVTPQRQITKPSEPTGPLTVEDVRKDSVLLSWKPPTDDGGSSLTGYVIMKRDAKRPTWSPAGKCDATTTAFKVKDLLEGTEYFFKVVAENKAGQSDGLETDTTTLMKSPYDKPSAPLGPIELSDLKADSVTLTWKPPTSDGGSPIKNYIVERKDTRKTSWTKVSTVDAKSPLSCVAQKLLEDVPYMFRVMAVNEEGQSPPLEADKEIVPKAPADVPGKPTGPIKFSQVLADSVTLAWGPPKKDGGSVVTSYTVEQSRDNGRSWEKTGTVEAHTTMLTAKDLKEGQKYKFRVCANNEIGAGQPLESDSVTPQRQITKPSEPTGPLTVEDVRKDSVLLSWKPPTDDGGSPLTGYVIMKRDAKRPTWSPAGKCDATTTAFKVKDLLEGTEYFFKVVAENKAGQSDGLETDTTTLVKSPYDVPGKPTGPIKFSQVLADSVTLAWGPPKKDGGSVVTSYTVEQSRDNGRSWEQTGTVEAHTTMLTAKDLKEGQKYKFRVCANNEIGAGQPLESDSVTPQRQITKPSEPTGPLTIEDVRKDSVLLSWKPPTDDGGSPLTGYVIMKRDAKRPTWSPAGKCDATTTAFKVKDLLEGTEYFFKVVAENKAGQSDGLETDTTTLVKSPYDKPSAPGGPIEFSDLKADSVTLTWKPPTSDGGSPIKNYIVERKDARKTSWTKVSTVDAKFPLSCVAQKLLEDVPYMFRVMAVNEEGQSPPLEADKEIVPKAPADVPGKPTGPIKFSQVLADSVTLAWGRPKKDGGSVVTSYTVEQSRDNGRSWEQTGTVEAHTTMLTAKDLKEGQKYKFRVCANNEIGAGQPLESDSVTPQRKISKPSQPTGPLTTKDVQKDSVTLSWKPPTEDGGSPLTGYVIMKRDHKRSTWSPSGKCDGSTTEFKVQDLQEGTEYFFKVLAENKVGQSDGLETETSTLIKSPFDKPSQPVGPLEISNVTDSTADLTWQAPKSDGGSPLTSYIIESRPSNRSTWNPSGKVKGDQTSFTVPDLRLDTEYIFRVIAVNSEGQSSPLEGKEAAKPKKKITPPEPPQNVRAARIGVDYVTLEWKPPAKDGGAKVTAYKIEKCEEIDGDWTKVTEIKSTDTSYKVERLKENVGYYFSVSAKNEAGYSEPCEADALIKPKKPEGKPSAPEGPIELSDLDKTTVTLTWRPPTSDGGSPLTGYVIERREAARTQWTKLDSTLPTDTTLTTRNLIEGNEYYFRVCAENKHGRSEWLETDQSVKMRSPFEKPGRPVGPMELTDVTRNSVKLTWNPPESDGGTSITKYIIESRPSARSNWSPIGEVKGDTLTFTPDDLREGTEYHFRVMAVNKEGQGPALEAKETVKPEKKIDPPSQPTSLKIGKVGPDFVTLDWKAPLENGGSKVTGYKVEMSEAGSDKWTKVADLDSYDTGYKVTSLRDDKNYLFSVTAKNSAGYGEPSLTDKAVKPKRAEEKPGTPQGPLQMKDVEKTSVTLAWKAPASDGGSPLTGYIVEKKEVSRPTWTRVEKISPDETKFIVKNLLEGSDYHFRVSAENKHGASAPLVTDSSVKPKSKFDKPGKPLGPIEFSDVKENSVSLSWKPPSSDGGKPIEKYIIEHRDLRRSTWVKAGSVPGDATTFTADNLTDGNSYMFRVTAVNQEGESQPLESLDTVKPQRPASTPGSPTNLKVKEVGKDFAKVEWSAPKSDGGSKITGYRLFAKIDGSDDWKEFGNVGPLDSSFTFKDLSDKKKYFFAVVAENKLGQGDRLETDSSFKPKKPATKPSQPVGPIKFSDITRSSVTLTWRPSEDDGGDMISGYILERKEAWKTSWSPVTEVSPDITSYCVQKLREGQEYVFRVMAENSIGRSKPLESDSVTPKHPFSPPSAPEGPLETSNLTATTVDLSWKPPKSDGGQPLTGYNIERRDAKRSTWTPVDKVKPNVTTYTVQNLSTGADYSFRVTAENSEGVSPPLETSATVRPFKELEAPSQPKGPLKMSDFKETSVTLHWQHPAEDGGSSIMQYDLEVQEGKKDWRPLSKVESYTTKFKAADLKEGTKYKFRVSAVNKVGQSKPLESDGVVLEKPPEKPGPPTYPFTMTEFTRNSLTLTWGPSQTDGGSAILHYILEKRESWKSTFQHVTKVKPEGQGKKLTHCVEGLKEDQDYMFRVFAENSVGASKAIETDTPYKPRSPFSVPDPPVGPIIVDVGQAEVSIRWKSPESTGGLDLTSYYIERRDTRHTSWIKVAKVEPNIHSYCIQNLQEGNEYVFRVYAENPEGRSLALETKGPVTPGKPAAAPSVPTGPVRFEDVKETSLTLDWLPPKQDGGSPLTGYLIKVSTDGSEFKDIGTTESQITKLKVKDLKTGSKHVFQVVASNKVGQSKPLESDSVVPQRKATKPSKPKGPIKVEDVNRSSCTIQWNPPEDDGGAPLKNYLIEKREATRTSWSRADKISPDITTHTVQNLTEGAQYYFRVLAENKVGTSEPLEMEQVVKIKSPYDKPSAPEGPLKVSDVGEKSAKLSWQAPRSDGGLPISGYVVQYKESRRSTWMTFREVSAQETTLTLTGLVPDTEYVAQVVAVNKEGHSPGLLSEPIRPKKVVAAPSAPQSVHIRNIGKDNLTVEWSAPDSDGGSRIKKYIVEQSGAGSDKWTKVSTVDSYKTYQAVGDLEQEVDWLFAVSAVNEVGQSERAVTSKPVKLDKPIESPSPPLGPMEFSNITKKGGRVSWKPSANDGGSPVTHYAVEKREAWKSTWVPVERVPSNKTSCDLIHLTEGQEIFLRVLAENVAGQSKPLEGETPLVPKSPYNKPSAPEDLKATNVTSSTASLQWRAPSDTGGLPITSYQVERRDKRWGSWVKAGATKGGVTTLDVTSLLEGSEYYFRVSAANDEGTGPFVETTQAVKPVKEPVAPDRPVGPIRFSSVQVTSLTLDWQPPREDGGSPITAYKVEVSSRQDVWTEVTITDANVTKVDVKDLKEGQKVWFRVTAFNKVGASKPLDSDSIVPQREKSAPSIPTRPIEAKVQSRDSVSLTWGPPEDDGGSPITGYVVEKREALRMSWSRAEKVAGAVTKTTVRNLTEGSDFLFRVAAVNREGTSEFLEMERPIKVKSPYSVPSAPQGPLKISDITKDSCVLEWAAPKSDGGQPVQNYVVEIREARRSMWTRAGTCKPDKTSYTAKNLVVNNEYYFRVKAINAEGESEPLEGSESLVPKIKQDPPSKPASINLPRSPAGTLTVEWKPPSRDGGARVKKYIVQMKEDSPTADWSDVATTDAFTTKVSVPDLDSEKKYKFRVAALNDVGQGDFLETERPGSPAKTLYAPSPPQSLRVKEVQRDSVSIAWDHSASDGGSPLTNYIIEKKEQWKSTWAHVDRVKSVVTSAEVLYLAEGTAYEIRVMAENAIGISEPAVLKDAVVPQSPYKPPSAPMGPLEVKEITSTTATISWKPPQTDGGLPVKRYTIERRDAKRQAWMKVDTVKPTSTTHQITGLTEGTNYVFRVFAENAEGVSTPLESDTPVTCRRAPEKPGCPSGKLKISKVTPDTVTLDWLPPLDDGGSPLTAYIIEALEGDTREWKTVAEVEPAATRHLVRNLTEGHDYRFRICAQNAIGRSKPVEADASVVPSRPVEPPGAPRGPLKAENIGRDSIKLSWQPPLDDGGMPVTGYLVDKLDIQRGGWVRAARLSPDQTSHVVNSLIADHDYNFRVYAENKIGVGEPLDMKASIKCKSPYNVPSSPKDLVVSDVTDESAQLEWSAPEKDGGSKITGYVIEKRDAGKQQWMRVGQTDAKTRSIKARNLLEGRPYSFRVMAENAEGLSEPLTLHKPITPMKPIEPPGAPENLECIRVEREAATLQWRKPRVDGGANITSYVVEKREGKAASWLPAGETDSLTTGVTYTVQNLLEDYEYTFRVRAKNSAGLGEPATLKETVIPSRPLEKPSRPVGPLEVSNVTEDSVTLAWHKPEVDGGAPLTNYIVEKCDTRRPRWVRVDSLPSDQTEFKVHNLLEGVDYKFRVMAENKVGVSEPLETEATVKPLCPFGPPTVPVGPIKTSKITRDSATIQWEKPVSDGGSPITGYLVERREGSKRAWMYCGRTDAETMTMTCTALYENNEYYFRVNAENKYGRSKPLDSDIPVVPKRIFDKPSAPEHFRAEKIDKDSLTLVWSPPEDDDGSISRYIVEQRHPDEDTWTKTAELPGKTKWAMVKHLQPGQSYLFRVSAENPAGRSQPTELSSPVTLKIKKEKPKALKEAPQVEELGKDFVYLTWSPPEADGGSPVTGYVLERLDISGKSWLPVTSQPIKDTAYRVTQLREHVTYEFRVRAQNAVGVSEPSPASEPFMCGHKLAREPPKFIADFGDLSVPVGQDAKFTCQVVGLPTPEVSWYRNCREVYEGRKCTVRHENTNMTLIVKNVDFSDQGEVECQARNKFGVVSIRATLNILAAPQVEETYGKGLRFCRGDTIKVRVPISGTPTPKTTWSRGREIIEVGSRRGRADIIGTNLHTTMIIEDCVKADEGSYTLVVENKLGSVSVDVPICVVEPPDSPDKPVIQEVDKHSVQITWNAPAYDGGSPIVGYVVERRDPITGIWRWALSTSDAFCTVACLEEHGEHRFRVMAENRFGVSEPSLESEIVVTKEALPDIDYDGLYDDKFLGSEIDVNRIKGDVLGKYIICEELGRGAFGVVYRAVERATGKNWAAKFIHCRPQDKDNIRHEIDVMNSLHHPKLLQLHEAFDQRGEMVMILELLSGGELFDRLVEEDYTLTEADCVTYMRQICQGVQHMHHNNILHLDLKPENVMCVTRETNDIKIIDFGLAQRLEEGKQVKVLFGTAEFCAPEIVNYEAVSFSTDMWSVGVLSYVLLSGYSPFAGDDNHQTFQFVNQADYDFDDEVWERVSADAKDFIQRLLIKDKKQRMTIDEALEHPWLNPRSRSSAATELSDGATQKPQLGKPLSTAGHKHYRDRTKRKEDALDVLPIGRLSRDSADMRKEGGQGIVMRKLVMEMPDHAPYFLEELVPVTGLEGSKTQLSCKVDGKPMPKIVW